MKKFLLCLAIATTFLIQNNSSAQSTGINYSFSQIGGSMVFNNSGVGNVSLIPGGSDDVVISFTVPATWSGFYYGGTWFPQGSIITVSSNGWLSLTSQSSAMPLNGLSSTPLIIAPLWDDLKVHSNGEVSYRISGGAGVRALVVEWRGMLWDHNGTDSAISFQAIIYDNAQVNTSMRNVIEFRYKRNGSGSANINNGSGGASIGLSGFCAGDVFAFTDNTGLPDKTAPENSSIAQKPQEVLWHRFTPVVHPNDECVNAELINFDPALPLASVNATTLHSTQSAGSLPSCAIGFGQVRDVWFTFTKPAGITNFEIYTDSLDCRGSNYTTGIELFSSCGSASIACDIGSTGPGTTNAVSYLNITNQSCNAQQYWVRAFSLDTLYPGYFRFNLRSPGSMCINANDITGCGLPYTSSGVMLTCGFGNEYDSTNSVPHSPYSFGDDYVYSFTPASDICVDVSLSNTPPNSSPGLFVSNGCPSTGNNIASAIGNGGTTISFNNISLLAGNTYYFVIDNNSWCGLTCLSGFQFSIVPTINPSPVNDNCAAALNIPVVVSSTCTGAIDYHNNCANPTAPATIPLPGCGNFTDGVTGDVWFTFSSSGTNLHRIIIDPGTAPAAEDLSLAIYSGTCGSLTLVNCDDHSNGVMPSAVVVPPAAGTVYYVRVWSNNGTHPGNFRICVLTGCTAPNDFCATAIPLTPGQYVTGDNSCATDINEPPPATCWTVSLSAQRNNVWYSFAATTTSMTIKIHLLTLFDSQMALYESTGPCTGLNQIFCNDNSLLACEMTVGRQSEIDATGLVVGNLYYIRVEGGGSNTGTFEIMAQPDTIPFPALYAQDCPLAIPLCDNSTITNSSTLYYGSGNLCDVEENTTCLVNGETNSVFYTFNVTGTGAGTPVEFTITPQGMSNCDFMLWCIDTVFNNGDQIPAVPDYCDNLANTSMFPAVICNYSFQGTTGCSADAGLCNMICYQTYAYGDTGMVPAVVIPNGMTATFLLLVNNDLPQGFTLDWMGTPINNNTSYMVWQGGNNTDWNDLSNWGNGQCAVIPNCANGIPAVITAGAFNPVMTSNTSVSDLTINSGATLTISPGITLSICGNFTNNGQLACGAGSTLRFIGSSNATIDGTFNQGNNNFNNLEISKSGNAQVMLLTDIYVEGYDSINSGSFNTNTHNIEVGGNFYNYNGNSSYVTSLPSTITFTGRSLQQQHFRNDGQALVLDNITMNQLTAASLKLDTNATSDLITMNGTLTLTSGKIITGNRRVNLASVSGTCNAGNITSYVEGNLMRTIGIAPAAYEFPVGDSVKGYQRIRVDYIIGPPSNYFLLGKFRQWTNMPLAGPAVSECGNSGWQIYPPYDHGYWTLDASSAIGYGTYNITAYPLNATNQSGLSFTVLKAVSNNGQGPWVLEGNAYCPSTPVQVRRDSLTSFSDFSIAQSDIGNSIPDPEIDQSFIYVAPNPASGNANIYFKSALKESLVINLTDLTGRIILSSGAIDPKGKEMLMLNLQGIAPGIYLLNAKSARRSALIKLVVKGE